MADGFFEGLEVFSVTAFNILLVNLEACEAVDAGESSNHATVNPLECAAATMVFEMAVQFVAFQIGLFEPWEAELV
eukprot:1099499-Lingulodinium_polyedra.AAC.1